MKADLSYHLIEYAQLEYSTPPPPLHRPLLLNRRRQQVPEVKPEPYHGSVSHAANYRGLPNYPGAGAVASGSQMYEMMPPSGMFGPNLAGQAAASLLVGPSAAAAPTSPLAARYGFGPMRASSAGLGSLAAMAPRGLIGGPSLAPDRQEALPYALVPATGAFPFG